MTEYELKKEEAKARYMAKVSSLIRSENREQILKEASDKFEREYK